MLSPPVNLYLPGPGPWLIAMPHQQTVTVAAPVTLHLLASTGVGK